MLGFFYAALVRLVLFWGVPFGLWLVFVRPASSPLHGFSVHVAVGLLVLLGWLVVSTVQRFLSRRSAPPVRRDDSEGIRLR